VAKLSVIQLCAQPNVEENLNTIDKVLTTLPKADEHLVLLPECCLFFGGRDSQQLALAKQTANHEHESLSSKLSALATKHRLYLVAGTIPSLTDDQQKFHNRSYVFSPAGDMLDYYDKIHLFDVIVEDNEKNYLESKYTQAGDQIKHVTLPFANLGLTVCYDLRFPELYRALAVKGADIITVPAAFTKVTGQAHWLALLQARAIENQCYIMASGQQGKHANGRETWGHSMIVSPWGEVIDCIEEGVGSVTIDFAPQSLTKIRRSMPVNTHNKFMTELIK